MTEIISLQFPPFSRGPNNEHMAGLSIMKSENRKETREVYFLEMFLLEFLNLEMKQEKELPLFVFLIKFLQLPATKQKNRDKKIQTCFKLQKPSYTARTESKALTSDKSEDFPS